MNFNLTKTQELFRQMIREFAEKEVKPLAAEIDEQERFPAETVKKMAELGLFGIPVPAQYGGAGGDNIMYSIAIEELSKACATTGARIHRKERSGGHQSFVPAAFHSQETK